MKRTIFFILSLFLIGSSGLSMSSCKKKKKEEVTPTELVTSINLILDAPKGKQDVVVSANDLTGLEGKTSPNTITLDANTLYTGTITLENESVTPKKDVTNEYTISYRVVGADVTITANNKTPQVQTRGVTSGTGASIEIILNKAGKNSTTKFPLVVRP